jgi:hypothetical protein
MNPPSLSGAASAPSPARRGRLRRCLLKGCGRWFRATHPRCLYCGLACRQAAQRWRRWRAQQKYRASRNGRAHRQQQARRQRQKRQSSPPPAPGPPSSAEPTSAATAVSSSADNVSAAPPPSPEPLTAALVCAAGVASACAGAACVGKRLPNKREKVGLCPCDRPGCYELLAASGVRPTRRFCCALCRKALRCVRDRQARWQRRRRRGLRQPGRKRRQRGRSP